jgi:hypothetical protein
MQLAAVLASPAGVSGSATLAFEADDANGAELELTIEIAGATPDDVLDVVIDGIPVGSITVDPLGGGLLKLSSDEDDDGEGIELTFPDGLVLQVGSTILIGTDITGTFA